MATAWPAIILVYVSTCLSKNGRALLYFYIFGSAEERVELLKSLIRLCIQIAGAMEYLASKK